MLGGDNSLIGRIIAASTLVAMNLVFARVANRIPLEHLFTSSPTLLIERAGSSKSNWKTRT